MSVECFFVGISSRTRLVQRKVNVLQLFLYS